jgi:predicted dehydrogenase
MTLNVGIIGCGGIANGKHLPSLDKIEAVKLIGFCDIEIDKAELAADAYGVENAQVYKDYTQLLANDEIDGACMYAQYISQRDYCRCIRCR